MASLAAWVAPRGLCHSIRSAQDQNRCYQRAARTRGRIANGQRRWRRSDPMDSAPAYRRWAPTGYPWWAQLEVRFQLHIGSWDGIVAGSTKVLSWMINGMPTSGRIFTRPGFTPVRFGGDAQAQSGERQSGRQACGAGTDDANVVKSRVLHDNPNLAQVQAELKIPCYFSDLGAMATRTRSSPARLGVAIRGRHHGDLRWCRGARRDRRRGQ